MSNSGIAVSFKNVRKEYKDVKALQGVSFDVEQGAFFGLLGPNGAGKSTLINSMSGLVIPTSGSIEVMGADVQSEFRKTRRALGLVPQELISDPFFSIRELLELQSGYFGLKGSTQTRWIDELLERLALADKAKANANTNQLSGGMKRRVLIAMALVHRPQVIVLDEPTAGVDVDLRRTLWEFTKELHKQGHTIILTTHYLEEAEALCDRVAIIQKGQLKALDSTEALLSKHPFRYLKVRVEKHSPELPEALTSRLVDQDAGGLTFKVEKETSMSQMLGWLHASGLQVADISSRDATLEEVFLDLTAEGAAA
ncbi:MULTISPECIES: ABC transporter ATP-binding protein [Thiomicrorhabdus]|uniref:ABC transporter ATP-binding protein n=1 Tax=Thiomicrorhabdus heinhorstiae TaxID=2748010 RepID=A0ABS0BTP8_9GAMM|nr:MULTISPECIES: ABC transporter ATP-binding protein [Thiomicrorhabdus]MBF6057222.1 ABC transporter ATP-binding protein [Thiomicrorhabdus heinhorstiae]